MIVTSGQMEYFYWDDGLCDVVINSGIGNKTSGFTALPAGNTWENSWWFRNSGRSTGWWCSGSPVAWTLHPQYHSFANACPAMTKEVGNE